MDLCIHLSGKINIVLLFHYKGFILFSFTMLVNTNSMKMKTENIILKVQMSKEHKPGSQLSSQ